MSQSSYEQNNGHLDAKSFASYLRVIRTILSIIALILVISLFVGVDAHAVDVEIDTSKIVRIKNDTFPSTAEEAFDAFTVFQERIRYGDSSSYPYSDRNERYGWLADSSSLEGQDVYAVLYLYSNTYRVAFGASGSSGSLPVKDYDITQTEVHKLEDGAEVTTISYSGSVSGGSNNLSYNSTRGYLYRSVEYPLTSGYQQKFNFYDNETDALAALDYVVANGIPDPEPEPERQNATFTLPAGNVAYIDFGSSGQNYDVHVNMTFQFLSNIVSGSFPGANQKWGWTSDFPTSGVLPSSGLDYIPWGKVAPTNSLGQSKNGYSDKTLMTRDNTWSSTTSGRYLVINNPYEVTGTTLTIGTMLFNNDMVVNVDNAVSVRVYPTADKQGLVGMVYDVDDGQYFDGTFSDGSTTWVNQSGVDSVPQYGGNNYVASAESSESLASQIKNILTGLVEKITTMFTATHTAIANLVAVSGEFFANFGQLYTWLPGDVYTTLQSGMIIAITIGVLKAFL